MLFVDFADGIDGLLSPGAPVFGGLGKVLPIQGFVKDLEPDVLVTVFADLSDLLPTLDEQLAIGIIVPECGEFLASLGIVQGIVIRQLKETEHRGHPKLLALIQFTGQIVDDFIPTLFGKAIHQ